MFVLNVYFNFSLLLRFVERNMSSFPFSVIIQLRYVGAVEQHDTLYIHPFFSSAYGCKLFFFFNLRNDLPMKKIVYLR